MWSTLQVGEKQNAKRKECAWCVSGGAKTWYNVEGGESKVTSISKVSGRCVHRRQHLDSGLRKMTSVSVRAGDRIRSTLTF